jgi:hypothetical protein
MAKQKVLTKNEIRLETIKAVITDKDVKTRLNACFTKAKGNWPATLEALKKAKINKSVIKKLDLTHSLASITEDNQDLTIKLADQGKANSLREIALKHNTESLKKLIDPEKIPETVTGKNDEEKKNNYILRIRKSFYSKETSAVLHQMINDDTICIADVNTREGLKSFFANQPEFNIRQKSVYCAITNENAFKGIKDEYKSGIIEQLKILQRIQAICPTPESIPVLIKNNIHTSYRVAEIPEHTFIKYISKELGEVVAKQIYTNAVNNKIRIEHALTAMREAVIGTGVAAIDGKNTFKKRVDTFQKSADEQKIPLNWETLFGSVDLCECDECNSVYSPTVYFVELLQYLRNNNLDIEAKDGQKIKTDLKDITGTALEMLFRRRPDLGCLELTCKNANTVLPYIDLANEVMESFVVHLNEYAGNTLDPKQTTIEAFNIEDEIKSELMAQPQHTNYKAYCLIKKAKYPFTLPYHQPVDAIRIFLNYLETSRYELMKTFRTGLLKKNVDDKILPEDTIREDVDSNLLSDAGFSQLADLHDEAIDRAIDAEYLGLTQEEYIIITSEAFWKKEYFDIKSKHELSDDEYQQKIGLGATYEYYNYPDETAMLSTDEAMQDGLTFVKKQFLKRTGILYTDLVELLKTQFINPNYPRGKALTIFENLRFSYRFMQSLVDDKCKDPKDRFSKLIEYLEKNQSFVPYIDELLHPDPCKSKKMDPCVEIIDLKKWVYCCFEKVGKIIVLESLDFLRIEKPPKYDNESVGFLTRENTIIDLHGSIIGKVTAGGKVYDLTGQGFGYYAGVTPLIIKNMENNVVGYIDRDQLQNAHKEPIDYIQIKETCDLNRIRIRHLDGSAVTTEEYDKMHRFIRLWRRIGWTIDELDKAIIGLAGKSVQVSESELPVEDDCSRIFDDDCECLDNNDDLKCNENSRPKLVYEITPDFLHQLVAVKKLLELTGLEVIKLLTFWSDISTRGEKSLYKRLFLTHNILSIDKVFEADQNGNYLNKPATISEHMPVLMAALNLKSEEIDCIREFKQIPDELNIGNVSMLYRHSLFAKLLHMKLLELKEIVKLFNDPFTDADISLAFLTLWGKIEDAGFTWCELNYIIRDIDDKDKPLKPNKKTLLQLSKTIYEGLIAVKNDHPDIPEDENTKAKEEKSTTDLLRSKALLIFPPDVTENIIRLLEGTTLYSTNAPKKLVNTNDEFDKKLSKELRKKLKYDYTVGAIQVTGIFTETEMVAAKALFDDPKWGTAFDRIAKKPLSFYNDILLNILPKPNEGETDEVKKTILQGDVYIPDDEQDPDDPMVNTAPVKRYCFIRNFLPYLRNRLVVRFLVEILSTSCELEKEITEVLISEILETGSPVIKLLEIFKSISDQKPTAESGWNGYLIPTAEDSHIFVVKSDASPVLILNNQTLNFLQQDDPSDIWLSDPIKLKSGRPYKFEVTGLSSDLKDLTWKTETSLQSSIPQSVMLPDYSTKPFEDAYIQLHKISIIVKGFNLKADEALHICKHPGDFDNLNFATLTLAHWKRIQSFVRLRNSLPETDTNLIEFFTWAVNNSDKKLLSDKIAELTKWKKENIVKLLSDNHFNLNKSECFKNEKNLLKLQKALYVADKINIDINSLFEWAKPESKFWKCHEVAENIKNSIKARYKQEDWEKVIKPLNDQLRTNQRIALVNYLLVQQAIIEWPVTDEEGLFEFFLIDVKMESCMETSRLKQAISSVQLFIQRCLLGLEENKGFSANALDRDRWEWMQRQTIWTANRKVFLYPENWIEPELRDDKSPFFKELESALLQKDINSDTVKDALKDYLYKVDEVANMQVVGLYVENEIPDGEKELIQLKLHVFSRTRNAPYFYYYRYYDIQERNWYAWEKMQVDIPSYDVENSDKLISGNGTYLIPKVWNKRLLIFFPQFVKKSIARTIQKKTDATQEATFNDLANNTPGEAKPNEAWEIKLAWSEYRNGKWTQKQISKDCMNYYYYTRELTGDVWHEVYLGLPKINCFNFQVQLINDGIDISPFYIIEVYADNTYKYQKVGTVPSQSESFFFDGNQLRIGDNNRAFISIPTTNYHYNNINRIYPPTSVVSDPYYNDSNITINISSIQQDFSHSFTKDLLGKVNYEELANFFHYNLSVTNPDKAYGCAFLEGKLIYHELKNAYSLYNWELFFHTPITLADRLSKSQQFEVAMKWFHYVFNPYAEGIDAKRFWRFFPFHETNADNYLEDLFNSLQPNQYNEKISEWRDKPFRPHVVARSRPLAYMKWVVMKYLDNLIDWADYLFRQHTIETMNQATQLYILAYHILGPKPQIIPKRGKIKPQTYKSLLDKWDAFGNAMVEMEILFPFSNQTSLPMGVSNGVVGFSNIFGFSSSLYFCIPGNPKLLNYWKTIEDRLYNIRHCLTIEGIFSIPALWDPPIDPALLVQAAAQGLSLSSVLNDLNSPMPNYRFNYLLQKAFELCNELKSMGNALLSALEKKDTEALSNMRARHESSMNNLVMEVKNLLLKEAEKALEGLEQNRKSPVYRLQHYLKLIGEDLNKVPSGDSDFAELANQIEQPIDESGLKLIRYEKEEMDKANDAADFTRASGISETLAGIFHLIPNFGTDIKPFGVGAGFFWGGTFLGSAAQAVAKGLQVRAGDLSHQSSNSARKGGFLRQLQDRVFQANLAGYEIKQIDKQILSQQIRIQLANREIDNQQKQIENVHEIEDYLKNKYTNEELYSWMIGSIKTVYHQVYTMAYELAKKAEKAYCFERGLASSNFIQFGYWDSSRDGLQAGERLYVGLKQLESAYQEKRGYDYEITKQISLSQINPLALIEFRETGKCEFALPEVLFDMDYPGHYMRRIKSVALSVPCIVGPYTGINCTMRLIENKFRVNAFLNNSYTEKTDETDDRFSTFNIPVTSIAVSTGQNDSGVFELNFRDERYVPFEGAGVISKWRLELPELRQFDYDTITDVLIHIRYISSEGGERLKKAASDNVSLFHSSVEELGQQEGLFTIIDLQHDMPTEWYSAMQVKAGDTSRTLTIKNMENFLPFLTKMKNGKVRDLKTIKVKDVLLVHQSNLAYTDFSLDIGVDSNPFLNGAPVGNMKVAAIHDADIKMGEWKLIINNIIEPLEKPFMVIRFILGK